MVKIRPMSVDDRDAVIAVHMQSIYGLCKDHYSEEEMKAWTDFFTPALFDAGIKDTNNVGFVAVAENELVGFGYAHSEAQELRGLYVVPAHVNQGVGSLLVDRLEEAARARGVSRLSLHSTKNAVVFYRRLGFEVIGDVRHPINDAVALACVHMEKDLMAMRKEAR